MWTVLSLSAWKFWKIRDDFDPEGQLDSIAPPARSNPTAPRGRNHLEFFKIFMQTGTELSTLSIGQSIIECVTVQNVWKPYHVNGTNSEVIGQTMINAVREVARMIVCRWTICLMPPEIPVCCLRAWTLIFWSVTDLMWQTDAFEWKRFSAGRRAK